MGKIPKYKCGYRLCNKSVLGLKPKRKFCDTSHRTKEMYLVSHSEARGNKVVETAKLPKAKTRKCMFQGCDTSIEHRTRGAKFCELRHHNLTTYKAKLKTANKLKKKRYYEKHEIKFDKTVRKRNYEPGKQVLESGNALVYKGQILIYENYKEPLKTIEKSKGFGYYGTIAGTNDGKFVQCHICGHLFASVSVHIRAHKITGEKYKEMFELASGTSLISEENREMRQKNAVKPWDGKLPDHLIEYNRKVQAGEIKHNGNKGKNNDKRGSWTLEKRNKEGLCPDQVLEKIKDLAEKMGTTPSYDEFCAEYNYRFVGSISLQHGSWEAAVKKVGLLTRNELRKPDSERLIQDLIDFNERHKRIPMTSDFNRGLLRDRGVYIRIFGSLNNARIEAGMNAVIPMPFGQIMELTPEQYIEYQQGHHKSESKSAVYSKRWREKQKTNREARI